jgi:hypothetical protein
MILTTLKKIILMIQSPAGYRLDFWNSFKTNIFSELKPLPWMNYGAIIHIQNLLHPDANLFEYGSGSSTRYWISKGCNVISVEHDKVFFEKMQVSLANFCEYKLIEPELDQTIKSKSHESPESYKSSGYNDLSFESYVKAIDIYPDNYFDLVVVDGRARNACIKHAVSKIKRGGVLVLDNSDRNYYLKNTQILLNGWIQTTYRGAVRGLLHKEQTTIFQKP